jgi:hypothetical protein
MEMSRDYGALRLWSKVLTFIGILGVIFVVIGVIFAMLGAASFWQVFAILLIGGPLAALFASWPIALGQALRALADVAEYVRDQQQGVPAEQLSEGEQVPRDLQEKQSLASPALVHAFIHRSAWKGFSQKLDFRFTGLCEGRADRALVARFTRACYELD